MFSGELILSIPLKEFLSYQKQECKWKFHRIKFLLCNRGDSYSAGLRTVVAAKLQGKHPPAQVSSLLFATDVLKASASP